jgi:glycosyltransferase involved in cell wall biosynthesis
VINVSFVIVCYNHARYADRVARFLRLQRGVTDAEYIFIDDGSTDGTADALKNATAGWPNTFVY